MIFESSHEWYSYLGEQDAYNNKTISFTTRFNSDIILELESCYYLSYFIAKGDI